MNPGQMNIVYYSRRTGRRRLEFIESEGNEEEEDGTL